MKSTSIKDLQQIRLKIVANQAAREAEAAAHRLAQRKARAEQDLFARAIGAVQPLAGDNRVRHRFVPAPPWPTQRQLDEQRALHESLSDEFDAATLLDVDEQLSHRRPGIGPDVCAKLRRGGWAIQAQIDLHGLRSNEARQALTRFLHEAQRQGLRCVRVVHGKGLGSPGRAPVLKDKTRRWLMQKDGVLAFVQARAAEGGAGALVVLLK